MRQTTVHVDVEHFRSRVLQDALTEALAGYWRTRAAALLASCSRPGDFHGLSTAEDIAARDARLRADAARCLQHAYVIELGSEVSPDVVNVLSEVA